jgi:hypothetical protein
MTHAAPIARGLRGSYEPGRGDLTGKRILTQADAKEDRDRALANTRNALMSDPVTAVVIPGGRTYLLPTELLNFIRAEAQAEVE